MVDLFLSPLIQVIIDALASPILQKLGNLHKLEKNIKKLQCSLPMVQALLKDAAKRQITDDTVKVWLSDLKDKAYDCYDLLDELTTEVVLCMSRSSFIDEVYSWLLPLKPSRRLLEIAEEVEELLYELHEIVNQGFLFELKVGFVPSESSGIRETGSFVKDKSEIYGREGDKQKILKLVSPTQKGKTIEDVSVIAIVGIGGLGKTTLAQLVYNDEEVAQFFALRVWVYVSEDFNVRKLITKILRSASHRKCNFLDLDALQSQLQKMLRGKKFFLVLDDVWNADHKEWDKLKSLLKCGAEGSKIIVTTRSEKVALIMGVTSPYHLRGLSDHDCWILFKNRAFHNQEEQQEHLNLWPIGKKIIKKCGGVPLAAEDLGSVLFFKRKEKDWLYVLDSDLWNLEECNNGILPALKLSYIHLPSHLKLCFAFCSLFPKNHEIKKEKLIRLWIAEGLIQADGGNRTLEDIGEEYFNDFLYLSFFQEVEKCEDEGKSVYIIRDLIQDLAQTVRGNEFMIVGHGLDPSNLARTRHFSITCNFNSSFVQDLFKATHLRTLLFLFPGGNFEELPFVPSKFIYLRVLDLSGCGIKRVQNSINVLTYLRYLDLSDNPIQTLPGATCDLQNLQTLNLSGCKNLVGLPLEMGKVISLRHLDTTGCEALIRIPAGIGNLVHLQTLPIYIVGKGARESIFELNRLNLRGELNIKCLENVRDAKEAEKANLRGKGDLHTLGLLWGNNEDHNLKLAKGATSRSGPSHQNDSDPGFEEVEHILKCLEPNPNIIKFSIKGYSGINFPHWYLPKLVVLELINCRRCKLLPTLGQFPNLKTIYLQGMDSVVRIAQEFYCGNSQRPFPSLKELSLRDFPNLEEWSCIDEREAFPHLEKLVINKCPKLTTVPRFTSIQHLELRDCHTEIINSMMNITSLSILVIDTFPELLQLPGASLKNNKHLTSLKISSCRSLRELPSELENLTALKSLIICWCEELSTLPLGLEKLKDLEYLEINDCHSLISLPEEGIKGLTSLRSLSIENCNNMSSLSGGVHHLTALEHLNIMYCPKLAFLSYGMQNLSALRSLNIISCPELFSLPEGLQHVKTLQTLVIHSCPGLTALPDWIGNFPSLRSLSISNCCYLKSLPELWSLSTLQRLSIQGCPILERLCKQKRGRTSRNIAHIPHVYIGSPEFET